MHPCKGVKIIALNIAYTDFSYQWGNKSSQKIKGGGCWKQILLYIHTSSVLNV